MRQPRRDVPPIAAVPPEPAEPKESRVREVPIRCQSCGHAYDEHGPEAKHCSATLGDGFFPTVAVPCPCPGFRWVAADGPAVGSYTEPRQRP